MLMSHDDDFSIIWKSYNKQLDNDLFFFFFWWGGSVKIKITVLPRTVH